ncbi:MAG: beta strand repeat-containing protein, partial [Roseimicrobium sp.]
MLAALLDSQRIATAATNYYDNNGATAGLGSAGSSNWDLATTVWNSSNSGTNTNTPVAWVQGSDVGFQNGAAVTLTLPSNTTIQVNSIADGTSNTAVTINGSNVTTSILQLGAGGITKSGSAGTMTLGSVLNLQLIANQTWNAGAALNVDSLVSGGFNLTKTGSSTLTMTAANTYSGSTTVNQGTMTLSGANGSILSTSGITISGTGANQSASLLLDSTNTLNENRLDNSTWVALKTGAELRFQDNTATNTSETVGAVTMGVGQSTVSSRASTSRVATLTLASLTRVDGGLGLVRGSTLGGQASSVGKILLADNGTSLGTLIGTATSTSGLNNGSTKNLKIIPWIIGDTSTGNQGGNFLTYDTTSGIRTLGTNEYVLNGSLSSAAPDANYR